MKSTRSAFLLGNALFLFLIIAAAVPNASAQTETSPYYVIVGGFASRDNAERYTAYLLEQSYPARYAFNASRKLYYVYVRLTPNKQDAKQLAYHLRLETQFKDAWIYNGSLEGNALVENTIVAKASGITRQPHRKPDAEQQPTGNLPVAGPAGDSPAATTPAVTMPSVAEPAAAATVSVGEPASIPAAATAPAGKRFVFQLTNALDHTPINGNVHLLESEVDDKIDLYEANAEVSIPVPASGKLIVVCNLLGYKLAKRAINYGEPLKSIKGASIGAAQEVIIPISLVPVEKGDYIELERVKFHERSAILTPDSEAELHELLSLLNNPRCRIKLFGHTHDNTSGEIITMGDSNNFFSLDPNGNRAIHGSARELSRHRAEAVKAYLVSKGIAPSRIATKGYGAVLAIYEHANANERIEVQITRN